ncbi:MAG: carboxypeptidase-like regulatory domain-containing protein [Verrucomicrobiae bacterium]
MKRRRVIVVFAVVLLAVGLFWLLRVPPKEPDAGSAFAPAETSRTAQAQSAPIVEAERFKEASAQVESIFSSPIKFYGRVIDQNGNLVPYAEIGYTAADKFNASGSNYTGRADAEGTFQITGIKGAGLAVTVRKEGYYLIHNPSDPSLPTSTATFAYGMGPDSYRRPAPPKDTPAIFVLQKMGKTEPLTFLSGRQFDVSPSGQPVTIDLGTGRTNGGGLQVESWLGDTSQRPFDWRYQLSISNGGLVERIGQFDFQAPEDGYQTTMEISMPAKLEKWSSRMEKNYFARLANGNYARFKIRFYPGPQRNFVVLESYVNPKPGSRNLEFDPQQQVKTP